MGKYTLPAERIARSQHGKALSMKSCGQAVWIRPARRRKSHRPCLKCTAAKMATTA
nr:MAG TPA: hypothetical protein [Caudoviricetes sp.]